MIPVQKEEKQAALFLRISAFVYLVSGFAFLFVPMPILSAFNWLSIRIFPNLPLTPIDDERFWTALAFSMMMTITAMISTKVKPLSPGINFIINSEITNASFDHTRLSCFYYGRLQVAG